MHETSARTWCTGKTYLFYFWLCWVFLAARAFSSCSEQGLLCSCGAWASHCGSFSCGRASSRQPQFQWPWLPDSKAVSIVVALGLCCSVARGIFLDPWSNLYLLHWQVDSSPPSHQGSRLIGFRATIQRRPDIRQDWVPMCPPPVSLLSSWVNASVCGKQGPYFLVWTLPL